MRNFIDYPVTLKDTIMPILVNRVEGMDWRYTELLNPLTDTSIVFGRDLKNWPLGMHPNMFLHYCISTPVPEDLDWKYEKFHTPLTYGLYNEMLAIHFSELGYNESQIEKEVNAIAAMMHFIHHAIIGTPMDYLPKPVFEFIRINNDDDYICMSPHNFTMHSRLCELIENNVVTTKGNLLRCLMNV